MAKKVEKISEENVDLETGEILENVYEDKSGKLGKVIITETRRADGTLRIQEDYSNCPTRAEQFGSFTVQQLVDKYKPDELAAYLAAKNAGRQEILMHDFSVEPSPEEARNTKYHYQKYFRSLAPNIQQMFQSPLEFLKYMDNPANAEKMVELGIFKKRDVEKIIDTKPISSEPSKLDGSIEGSVAKK